MRRQTMFAIGKGLWCFACSTEIRLVLCHEPATQLRVTVAGRVALLRSLWRKIDRSEKPSHA